MDFHISNSGDDVRSGLSSGEAWRTLGRARSQIFEPGDRLLLERGSVWRGMLELRGLRGVPGNPVVLGAYGTGAPPVLHRDGNRDEICVLLENPSHVTVENLDFSDACQGIVLHLTAPQREVCVSGCRFSRISGLSYRGAEVDGKFFVSSAGIMVSGEWGSEPLLDGLAIRDCRSSNDCNALWWVSSMQDEQLRDGSGVYSVRNFQASDCVCEGGCFGWWIFGIQGGKIERVTATKNGISEFWAGNTAAGIEHCHDILVEDCEFSYCNRPVFNPDGCGLDLEGGGNRNIVVRNCRIGFNHGAGMMLYDKGGGNSEIRIEGCRFDQNCANQLKPGGYEIVLLGHNEAVLIENNTFRPRPGIAPVLGGNGAILRDNHSIRYELTAVKESF